MGVFVLGGFAISFIVWVLLGRACIFFLQEIWKCGCGSREEAEAKWARISVPVRVAFWLLWWGILFWFFGGRNFYYDAKIDHLCAVDGGIKVYETVKLPENRFDKWGGVNFYHPTQGENALGSEYIFRSTDSYFREGQPKMSKTHVQIFRQRDMKLLGQVITYIRDGGDHPFRWNGSEYRCPDAANGVILMRKIFTK
jgi:hypothetical protein